MKFQVIYFSKKGNTKKLAEVIASELNVVAKDVKDVKLNEDTFVLLGSGYYGGKPAKIITKFIEDNTFKSRKVALFGTSGGGEKIEVKEMENMIKIKGAYLKGKFFCKGKIFLINCGRPNDANFYEAEKFANHIIK